MKKKNISGSHFGKTANDKVNELLSALLEAAVVVSIISWITIGRRPALVVIIVIPLVILITIWSAWALNYTIVAAFLLACSMFYTKAVTVKMLPFDNKPEFNVVVNLPEGMALPVTANVTRSLADVLRKVPDVMAVQTYVGTASPFNFNGMVRHYYLRGKAWKGVGGRHPGHVARQGRPLAQQP